MTQDENVAHPISPYRVGYGNDIHQLVEGRRLILGGVHVPYAKGQKAHSDGDVLAHAICDALLGAAALGDIGTHYPDNDPAFKDADSRIFLRGVREKLDGAGYAIVNIDSTVELQEPRLASHIPAMRNQIATALGIDVGQVNVKAKTAERLGDVGEHRAVRAEAVVMICRKT